MAFQRLGRRLEDGVAAYITANKASMLSGVDIITPKQADSADAPWLAVYSGVSVPWSDNDRRGEIRGPMRTTLRISIAEHMNGTAIDQYCGEFLDIIARAPRVGFCKATTAASNTFIIDWQSVGSAPTQIVNGTKLRIAGEQYTVSTNTNTAATENTIVLTTTASVTINTPIFIESPVDFPEFGDLKNYLNALGTISVWRIAFVSESANVQGDLRLQDYEFEIDGVNSPNLA